MSMQPHLQPNPVDVSDPSSVDPSAAATAAVAAAAAAAAAAAHSQNNPSPNPSIPQSAIPQAASLFTPASRQRPHSLLHPHLRMPPPTIGSNQVPVSLSLPSQQAIIRQRQRDRAHLPLSLPLAPNSLPLDPSIHNPLSNELLDPNALDNVLPSDQNNTPNNQSQHEVVAAAATNSSRNVLHRMGSRSHPSTPLSMRAPTPPSAKSRPYPVPQPLASDAGSTASRRTAPIDHSSGSIRSYGNAMQDESQPRVNPNANTSSPILSLRKRGTQHMSRKSPATSPTNNMSPRLQFSSAEVHGPVKRRRSFNGYNPNATVSPRVAQQLAQQQQQSSRPISAADMASMSKAIHPQPGATRPMSLQMLSYGQDHLSLQHSNAAAVAVRGDPQLLAQMSNGRLTPRPNAFVAHQGHELQKRRHAQFMQSPSNGRGNTSNADHDSAKMSTDNSSLPPNFRRADTGMPMSQPVEPNAQSSGLPATSNAPVSGSPRFTLGNNAVPMDMNGQDLVYGLENKGISRILPADQLPRNPSVAAAAMSSMGAPSPVPPHPKKGQPNIRSTAHRNVKNEQSNNRARNPVEKSIENMNGSAQLQGGAPRPMDAQSQKNVSDALAKRKQLQANGNTKTNSELQSGITNKATSNQTANGIENKDGTRGRIASESAKAKLGMEFPHSGNIPSNFAATANALKTKTGDDGEGETRSIKGERHSLQNRASTPSQKSAPSGGSNAIEKRASQGSGSSRRARGRSKARSSGGSKRSRAERGGQARNNSSRGIPASQPPRAIGADVKNPSPLTNQGKTSTRNVQPDRFSMALNLTPGMAGIADASSSPDKRRNAKNDGSTSRPNVSQRIQKASEGKVAFDGGVENGNDQSTHDPLLGRQSPSSLTGADSAHLLEILQSTPGGRAGDSTGLDTVDSMQQYALVTNGHNGKVNGSSGANYPYGFSPFLPGSVEDENMLGTMLGSMADTVGLCSPEFEDESMLGVPDPGDLMVSRSRS